jgi:hypothetical protein
MVDLVYERVAHDEPRHLGGSSRLVSIWIVRGCRAIRWCRGSAGRKGVVAYPGVDKADTGSTIYAGWSLASAS